MSLSDKVQENMFGRWVSEKNLKQFIQEYRMIFTGMALVGDVKRLWDRLHELAGEGLI